MTYARFETTLVMLMILGMLGVLVWAVLNPPPASKAPVEARK